MNNYFFHTDVYEKYYNCSTYTIEEWNSFGVKRPIVGSICFLIGVLTTVKFINFQKFKN